MKNTIFLLMLCFTLVVQSQHQQEKNAIKKVITTFFDGLHKGDSTIMKATLHKNIKIQTTGNNKQGMPFLRTETKKQLLTNIANKKPEHIYFEKLLSFDIKIDGNLASVWTPYEFYFNNNFSHCGANSFQLYKNNNTWQIIYLIDMRRRANCTAQKK